MAVTEVNYTQTGDSNKDFTVTFPFLEAAHVHLQLGGVTKTVSTHWTIAGSVITFEDGVLTSGENKIRIYRDTTILNPKSIFQPGSSIRAADLNDNIQQLLYAIQEIGTLKGDDDVLFTLGSKGQITVNSSTDWTIAGTGVITAAMLASNSVDSDELISGSVDGTHISNDAINSQHYAAGSIDLEHMSANSIDSDQYVDGSIDTAHIGNDQVTYAKIQDIGTANRVLGRASTGEVQEVQVATAMIADGAVTGDKLAAAAPTTPVGTVIWYAGGTAPTGYLKANGDAITNGTGTTQGVEADFSTLYAIVGANLPDLRGEFVRGFDDGKGTDSGRAIRSTQGDLFKNHGHKFGADDQVKVQGGYESLGTFSYDATSSNSGTAHHCLTLNAGGDHDGGTETRPRNVALLACIKY